MHKQEWIDEYNQEMENYGKSMLNHDDDYPTQEELYEPIKHFQDESDYSESDDYDSGTIRHFQE